MKSKAAEKTEIKASNGTDSKLYLTRSRIEMHQRNFTDEPYALTQSTTRSQVRRGLQGKTGSFSIFFEHNQRNITGYCIGFSATGKTFTLGCCQFRGRNLEMLRQWALAKKAA